MNNLLVIAFHYPPDNSSTGVLRTLKFTEYLLNHNWCSHVITAPSDLYLSRDPAGSGAIPPQIKVERVWGCDVKKVFGIRGIYPSWLGVPDRYWPWFFAARRAGARAIRKNRIHVIYSTYPLPTAHLVGLSLKKRFGLPWVADFRDPWATEGDSGFAARIEAHLERKVVSSADRVICNTPAMRRSFLARYPDLPTQKFVTITNGYDEKDFASIIPVRIPKFQIFYSGTIDLENRNPKGLLAAIRYALDQGWLDSTDLQVTFLGCGSYGNSQQFRKDLKDFSLEPYVHAVIERISYREALARMAGSDVVVVFSENISDANNGSNIQQWTAMQVPAKLYEYLRVGRPFLALVGDGAVRELLEKTGAGVPISSQDTEKIARTLKYYYDNKMVKNTLSNQTKINVSVSNYSRENLTALLAHELDSLVA